MVIEQLAIGFFLGVVMPYLPQLLTIGGAYIGKGIKFFTKKFLGIKADEVNKDIAITLQAIQEELLKADVNGNPNITSNDTIKDVFNKFLTK